MLSKDYRFSSERLLFRGIAREDAELIVAWRSDPVNYRNFRSGASLTLESHLAWFERYLGDSTRYDFMVLGPDGKPIGTVSLSDVTSESCEIGYMIGDVASRGRGYASEAVRAACGVAFDELGVDRVDARILPGNVASERAAASAGLVEHEHVWSIEKRSLD